MGCDVRKQFNQSHLFKRADAYNLQHLGQAKTQPEFLADDGGQDIDAHGDPSHSLDGVVGGPKEVLDAEVLLDPFEEQFDAPTQLVEHGDNQSRQLEVIAQKDQDLTVLRVAITDTAQSLRTMSNTPGSGQTEEVITAQAGGLIDGAGLQPTKLDTGFAAGDK